MGVRCMGALWCLLALLALTKSAAVTMATEETLVVAKSDGDGETTPTVVEPKPSEVPTTEGPTPALKLTQMDVRSDVALRYARTAVVTKVKNPARRAQEATFRVLLPETAFISGFTMILDGKPYKAYVKEKEEAKQIYNEAVSQGIGAAHIAAKARDSNHFTVSVNVEGNTTAVFNLTYEELLVRRNKVYNHAINLHPGALVPKLTVTVHIKESAKITELRVPEVRTGNEVDATEEDAQNSQAVIERGHDDREATITFKPDIAEQQRLMDVYAAKSKESQSESNAYRRWPSQDEKPAPEGVLGQFVVQYDVDRPKEGEILVSDGYFVHFFAPSSLPPLHKHVVFVLDTSGSMMDRKIVQLRQAMRTILGELNKGDYFNIVQFDSGVKVFDLKEADEPPKPNSYNFNYYEYAASKPTTLVPPSPATEENVAKAKIIVSRLDASGGTNIYSALNVAVDLIQKGIGWTPEVTTPASNGSTTEGPMALPLEAKSNETPKEATEKGDVTEEKKEGTKKLEPIVIFLTDGEPTVGETNTVRIINRLTEKNYGENKASIFSLAFGEDADRSFLRKLSLRSDGFMRHIYEAADAALQLRDFYRQVSSPLLAHVSFTYPPEQVKQDSLTKNKFRTFYAGSETVVAGRIADGSTELAPTVLGFCGVVDDGGFTRKKYEIFPKVPVASPRGEYLPLERLWAYLTVKQLLDERDATDGPVDGPVTDGPTSDGPTPDGPTPDGPTPDGPTPDVKDKENTPEKRALAIALKYEFVTPLTSLVVVKPNATNAVDAESVDKHSDEPTFAHAFGAVPLAVNSFQSPVGIAGPPGAMPQFGYKAAFSSAIGPFQNMALPAPIFEDSVDDIAVDEEEGSGISGSGSSHSKVGHGQHAYWHSSSVVSDAMVGSHSHWHPTSDFQLALLQVTSTRPAPLPSTTAVPRLAALRLGDFPWVESLLDPAADKITLSPNATKVELELVRGDVPKASDGDAQCARATDGAAGVCVYLTRCDAARDITAALYADTFCVVNDKYAGVCCPGAKVDIKAH